MTSYPLAAILAYTFFGVTALAAQAGPSTGDLARTLSNGTNIEARLVEPLTTKHRKIGDKVKAEITREVKDADGTIIFPSGSPATIEILDLKGADKDNEAGVLALAIREVQVGSEHFKIKSSGSKSDRSRKPGWTIYTDPDEPGAPTGAIRLGEVPEDGRVGEEVVLNPGQQFEFELTETAVISVDD